MPVARRRIAALFAGVMMLVLLLAESGFACGMPARPARSSPASAGDAMSATADMADMADMAGRDTPSPGDTAWAQGSDDASCRLPWALSGCRDMAPCAPAAWKT